MHTEASIRTYTGRYFDILNPQAKDVSIIDIALSQLCRFTGHTEEFYSVAQHRRLTPPAPGAGRIIP